VACHWQLVLNQAYCAPWRWHACAETCRGCVFNTHVRLITYPGPPACNTARSVPRQTQRANTRQWDQQAKPQHVNQRKWATSHVSRLVPNRPFVGHIPGASIRSGALLLSQRVNVDKPGERRYGSPVTPCCCLPTLLSSTLQHFDVAVCSYEFQDGWLRSMSSRSSP
jgi:hypothetical protein